MDNSCCLLLIFEQVMIFLEMWSTCKQSIMLASHILTAQCRRMRAMGLLVQQTQVPSEPHVHITSINRVADHIIAVSRMCTMPA